MATVSITNTTANISGKTMVTVEGDRSITGLLTFSRGASAPFAVNSGAAKVTNLDADLLDGQDGAYYAVAAALNASNLTSGTVPAARLPTTITSPQTTEGRLTLTSGTAVTITDVTAAGTLYFTPYKGNRIALYDGAATWNTYAFTEKSLALTLTSGKPYDVFVYDNSGVPALEVLVWTNDITRATALTTQDGVLVKSGATTRKYVGTIYASGANTTEDSVTKRYVWNYYNRVDRALKKLETTATWTYNSATFRQANGAATNQVDYVIGVQEEPVDATIQVTFQNPTSTNVPVVAFGISGTTQAGDQTCAGSFSTGNNGGVSVARYRGHPGLGRTYLTWLEGVVASGTSVNFYSNTASVGGSTTAANVQSGILGSLRG